MVLFLLTLHVHISLTAFSSLGTACLVEPAHLEGFPSGLDTKEFFACSVGDPALIPGLGRSHGEGNGNPLQYSCLENSMDREAWRATVQGTHPEYSLGTMARKSCNDFHNFVPEWVHQFCSHLTVIKSFSQTHLQGVGDKLLP